MLNRLFSDTWTQLVFGVLISFVHAKQFEDASVRRVVKQAPTSGALADQSSAESGFGGGGGGGIEHSKYFQYQHNPEHDKYEFGYRRGNEHHFKERYEKAAPHEGHFKTKVRWGDKKGGYGEHYWDYNHAGHDGGDGEGGYSDPVPSYTVNDDEDRSKTKRQLDANLGDRFNPNRRQYVTEESKNEEIIASESQHNSNPGFVKSFEDEIGMIQTYDIQKQGQPLKRNTSPQNTGQEEMIRKAVKVGKEIQANGNPQLYFDLDSGKVVDEKTGKSYILQPFN